METRNEGSPTAENGRIEEVMCIFAWYPCLETDAAFCGSHCFLWMRDVVLYGTMRKECCRDSNEIIREFMLELLDDQRAKEVARFVDKNSKDTLVGEEIEDRFLRRMRGAIVGSYSVIEGKSQSPTGASVLGLAHCH